MVASVTTSSFILHNRVNAAYGLPQSWQTQLECVTTSFFHPRYVRKQIPYTVVLVHILHTIVTHSSICISRNESLGSTQAIPSIVMDEFEKTSLNETKINEKTKYYNFILNKKCMQIKHFFFFICHRSFLLFRLIAAWKETRRAW